MKILTKEAPTAKTTARIKAEATDSKVKQQKRQTTRIKAETTKTTEERQTSKTLAPPQGSSATKLRKVQHKLQSKARNRGLDAGARLPRSKQSPQKEANKLVMSSSPWLISSEQSCHTEFIGNIFCKLRLIPNKIADKERVTTALNIKGPSSEPCYNYYNYAWTHTRIHTYPDKQTWRTAGCPGRSRASAVYRSP